MNNSRARPGVLQRIPPPLLFAAALIAGIVADRWLPLLGDHPAWRPELRWGGIALILLGVAHALPSVALFVRTRTTIVPHHKSAALVTGGPYRWTRNPMYVGLVLVYLGIAALVGSAWALLLLPLPVLAMNAVVIPMEERQLEAMFGPSYAEYKARVRRWL
jgi:protein-S-isoprenylcysteine O-methyltransferase Ste14